jgi:hypothetical protein
MSGGSFDYSYMRVNDFSDKLKLLLAGEEVEDCGKIYPFLGTDSSKKYARELLIDIQVESKKMAELMKATEWLFSGDDGLDTFLDNVEAIKGKYK